MGGITTWWTKRLLYDSMTRSVTSVTVYLRTGRLYKKTPRFDEIASLTGQLLIHAISINSGYTSRIVVSTRGTGIAL